LIAGNWSLATVEFGPGAWSFVMLSPIICPDTFRFRFPWKFHIVREGHDGIATTAEYTDEGGCRQVLPYSVSQSEAASLWFTVLSVVAYEMRVAAELANDGGNGAAEKNL
jgi:hypothetical protein